MTEYFDYVSVGSGMEYAMGAAYIAYEEHSSVKKIAIRAVRAACSHDLYSSGPVQAEMLNQSNKE